MPHVSHDDKKKQREWDRKVAAIKEGVRKRVPELYTKVPELPPRIGTLAFDHLTHPFLPSSNSPNILGKKLGTSGVELRKGLETKAAREQKRKNKTKDDDDNSDSDDDDAIGGLPYLLRKAAEGKRFEDMVIPDVMDAETGEELRLTKAAWSTEEGRINEGVSSLLNRGSQSSKIKNRPDSSHRIVPILSPREKSKLQKAGKRVLSVLALRHKSSSGDGDDGEDTQEEDVGSTEDSSGARRNSLEKTATLFDLKKQAAHDKLTHNTKKHHLYDETKVITDDSAEYWRHNQQGKVAVHHFDHLIHGLTREEIAEKEHHNQLHRLHLNFHHQTEGHLHVNHHKPLEEDLLNDLHHHHARKKVHPLVATFLRDGPVQPMYHKYWDKRVDKVVLPRDYVNDEDGDADSYISHDDTKLSHEKMAVATVSKQGRAEDGQGTARSTTSSIGFDSVESIMRDKSHPDNLHRPDSIPGGLSADIERAKKGDALLEEGKKLNMKENGDQPKVEDDDDSTVSILSDALDPKNEVSWRALEDRYYYEIRDHALDYEANKQWTKEKGVKGGVGGMDIAIRAYANWKMRSMKFVVQAIDDEEKKEVARLALEDELEINKPERLLDQVKVHNEERHKHRTYIKTFKYDIEIVSLKKLNDLGLVW